MARFAFDCCPVMTSSLPRSPCFTLGRNDVIDVVYYLSAAAKLVALLFGPLLLQWLFFPRATGALTLTVTKTYLDAWQSPARVRPTRSLAGFYRKWILTTARPPQSHDASACQVSVSYTHLTLPTIYSV